MAERGERHLVLGVDLQHLAKRLVRLVGAPLGGQRVAQVAPRLGRVGLAAPRPSGAGRPRRRRPSRRPRVRPDAAARRRRGRRPAPRRRRRAPVRTPLPRNGIGPAPKWSSRRDPLSIGAEASQPKLWRRYSSDSALAFAAPCCRCTRSWLGSIRKKKTAAEAPGRRLGILLAEQVRGPREIVAAGRCGIPRPLDALRLARVLGVVVDRKRRPWRLLRAGRRSLCHRLRPDVERRAVVDVDEGRSVRRAIPTHGREGQRLLIAQVTGAPHPERRLPSISPLV